MLWFFTRQQLAEERQREVEIAQKLLREEERMRRRKKLQPHLWEDPEQLKAKVMNEFDKF